MPKLTLGKVDYNGSGRRNCLAVLTWELADGRFTMQGEIWNPRMTDIYVGGQCVDMVAGFFPKNAVAQCMVAIWKRWHLNDMRAGTPAQEAWLRQYGHGKDYTETLAKLTEAGYNPDNGYVYGSKWLTEELPPEVIAEIQSWRTDPCPSSF